MNGTDEEGDHQDGDGGVQEVGVGTTRRELRGPLLATGAAAGLLTHGADPSAYLAMTMVPFRRHDRRSPTEGAYR